MRAPVLTSLMLRSRLVALSSAALVACSTPNRAAPDAESPDVASDVADATLADTTTTPDRPADATPPMDVAVPEDTGLECPAGQRFFNGSCRARCDATSICARGLACTVVEPGASLCLDVAACAWLGSDTQCVGVGSYNVYTRFGMQTRPYDPDPFDANPYDTTPYDDPDFRADSPYAEVSGCRGNARWVRVPVSGGGLACGARHDVTRCRREGTRCRLVAGSTGEVPSP